LKPITYVTSVEELNKIIETGVSNEKIEIIVGCYELSRYIKTPIAEMIRIISEARKKNLDVSLEWDVLNQEDRFLKTIEVIKKIPLHDLNSIRLQDPGAINYIKSNYSWLKIHLILENGNHNLIGLQKWCDFLGNQCQRIILSNELSKDHLKDYIQQLKIPIEVLVLGRILLFYSPRLLLSPLDKNLIENNFIEASGASEESPHSGFPILENQHGTFMFNVKDLYLLDHIDELAQMGINFTRLDLRFDNLFNQHISDLINFFSRNTPESSLTLKQTATRPFIKGFYNINKTDVLFNKLKNRLTQRLDQHYVGEVVDVERDKQLTVIIKQKNQLNLKDAELKLISPEGKEKIVKLNWIKNSNFVDVDIVTNNDIVLIPIVNGITVKTQVYLNPKT
jgi:putative protease